jgi:hypothetical protein
MQMLTTISVSANPQHLTQPKINEPLFLFVLWCIFVFEQLHWIYTTEFVLLQIIELYN